MKVKGFVDGQYDSLAEGLESIRGSGSAFRVAVMTGVGWFTAVLLNVLVLYAFDLHLGWKAPVLLLLALQAGIAIPSLPARIGVFEYICILCLSLFGVDQTVALSYGIVLHLVVIVPILVLGVIGFGWFGRRKTSILA
jgi:uncharacterized membrane protein YbhN (UPF0104 family)